MTEIRCKKCNRLLMKTLSVQLCSEIEVKCPKCGFIDTILMVVEYKGKRGTKMLSTTEIKCAKFNEAGAMEREIYSQM